MKSFSGFLKFAILVLTAAAPAFAQEHAVTATIPFDFFVADRFLPAGDYVFTSPYSGSVEIRSRDRRLVTFVIATPGMRESDHGSQLEFKKYSQGYFLHRVLCPVATGMNKIIPTGKREKKVSNREASLDVGSTVLIAAR